MLLGSRSFTIITCSRTFTRERCKRTTTAIQSLPLSSYPPTRQDTCWDGCLELHRRLIRRRYYSGSAPDVFGVVVAVVIVVAMVVVVVVVDILVFLTIITASVFVVYSSSLPS
jgi:hypothetical protein